MESIIRSSNWDEEEDEEQIELIFDELGNYKWVEEEPHIDSYLYNDEDSEEEFEINKANMEVKGAIIL